MTLFRLDASIRDEGSVSRAVADSLQRGWQQEHAGAAVVRRDLRLDPVPAGAWADAVGAAQTPQDAWTPAQRAAVATSATYVDELLAASAVVIATPLYNFGVAQHLKAWVDMLMVDPRISGAMPLVGTPVALVIARGGGYGPGTPREGWDHATPYLTRIFADALGGEVTVVAAELTLADVKPAMADLRPLAAQSREQAHAAADRTGREFARLVTAAAPA